MVCVSNERDSIILRAVDHTHSTNKQEILSLCSKLYVVRESYARVVHVQICFSRFIKVHNNCVVNLLWLNKSLDLDVG